MSLVARPALHFRGVANLDRALDHLKENFSLRSASPLWEVSRLVVARAITHTARRGSDAPARTAPAPRPPLKSLLNSLLAAGTLSVGAFEVITTLPKVY